MRLLIFVLVALMQAHLMAADANQPPKGFTALFNGKDLSGWKGGSTADPRKISPEQQAAWDADIPNHWKVENGEIVNDGHEPHLVTAKDYGDFELWLDWKLPAKGDSGIYLRGCPQVQIWDPADVEAHKNGSDKGSGGLWNNQKAERVPSEVADKPTGEWNRMYIKMVGERVTVLLNDKKVVDNVVLENYYDRAIPVFKTGAIHLQTHGNETRFRNLFIREIPAEEATKEILETSADETGFEPLLNGKDLTGWTGATGAYEVVDGELRAKAGASGNLLSDAEYDNFVVRLEFKLPPGGNNGLAIRAAKDAKDPSTDAMEIQILDDSPEHYPDLQPYQAHGSVYGLAPAARGYLRPAGQWNYEEVTVDGDHIVVTVNGFKVNDVNLAEVRGKNLDGHEHPGAWRTSGHFGFSSHVDPIAVRNLWIKRLTK